MTQSIEALAERAVEARNAYMVGSGKPDTEDRLWHAHRNAMEAFHSKATPEAWLTLTARNRELEKALKEAEEVFSLSERPAFPDPAYHLRVKKLGKEIGFGALMSTAEAGWREVNAEEGWPSGGEHTTGPCRATVNEVLKIIRAALSQKP